MIITITVEGLERALEGLERFVRDFPEAAAEGVKDVAEFHADVARTLVPVDTGSLQKSIRVDTESEGSRFSATVTAGGKIVNPKTGRIVDYVHYVEFGTSKTRAQPFMEPAYFATMREAGRIIRDAVDQRLRR